MDSTWTAGLEYEGELEIDEVLKGTASALRVAGVLAFGRNYRQRDGKRSTATGKNSSQTITLPASAGKGPQ
jgi:hypothetical protein